MMDVIAIQKGNENFAGIMERPGDYPEEVVGAALDWITDVSRQVYEIKKRLDGNLVMRMSQENATKMGIVDINGNRKIMTLKPGAIGCKHKTPDLEYERHGFDPAEIGALVYKPIWSLAKEARKVGGDKQLVIDELFQPGNSRIEIKEMGKK